MIVEVAPLPGVLLEVERKVAIVVDALRASASITALFDAGAPSIVVANGPEEAFAAVAGERARYLLCGEVGGLPPPGFDHGNSPTQLSGIDLVGRGVVLSTSNGTRALRAVSGARQALVATGRNGPAVARYALEAAEREAADLAIVCAGDDQGIHFSLEDFYFAGYLIDRLAALRAFSWPVDESDPGSGDPSRWTLDESAVAAQRLYQSYQSGDLEGANTAAALRMFRDARNGHSLPRIGYGADLEYCAALDCSTAVPTLVVRDGRLLLVDRR